MVPQNVIAFEDRIIKGMIKLKEKKSLLGWALIRYEQCAFEKRAFRQTCASTVERPCADKGEDSHPEEKREVSGETNLASTLISDSQHPELRENR